MTETKSNLPLTQYECLREDIRSKIKTGIYAPGEKIPSENNLCKIYSASRVTVRTALEELASEGVLIRKKGSGTYVSPRLNDSNSYLIGSFTQNCKNAGMKPSTQTLSVRSVIPPENISRLLGNENEAIEVQRIRFADKRPCVLEIDYLPSKLQTVANRLKHEPSMFEALKCEGIGPIVGFDDRFGACLAGDSMATELDCQPNTPLLTVLERLSDASGATIYISQQFIVTDRYTHQMGTINKLD